MFMLRLHHGAGQHGSNPKSLVTAPGSSAYGSAFSIGIPGCGLWWAVTSQNHQPRVNDLETLPGQVSRAALRIECMLSRTSLGSIHDFRIDAVSMQHHVFSLGVPYNVVEFLFFNSGRDVIKAIWTACVGC